MHFVIQNDTNLIVAKEVPDINYDVNLNTKDLTQVATRC